MSTTERSKIQWTDYTFNPWRGCTRVHAGCLHCYAETMSKRNPSVLGIWGPRGKRAIAAESYWRQPVKWNKEAAAAGERRRVFCASLADVFEGFDTMPPASHGEVDAARVRLWKIIEDTPRLDWLLLTKRPENITRMVPPAWMREWPANVMTGTSPCDQATADVCIPALLAVPGRHFLSMEPMIGPVEIARWMWPLHWHWDAKYKTPDEAIAAGAFAERKPQALVAAGRGFVKWVIVGGESGGGARPFNPDWARSIRDQCRAAGVPFFFKQTGANVVGLTVNGKGGDLDEIPEDLRVREFPR